ELARAERDQTGYDHTRHEVEYRGVCLLIGPIRRGGKQHDHFREHCHQSAGEEPGPDSAARAGVSVDLREDIAKYISDGKQQYGSADLERTDLADLGRHQVR